MEEQNRIRCPISMQPIEQKATTRGTGIKTGWNSESLLYFGPRQIRWYSYGGLSSHTDGPEASPFGQTLGSVRSKLYKVFQT